MSLQYGLTRKHTVIKHKRTKEHQKKKKEGKRKKQHWTNKNHHHHPPKGEKKEREIKQITGVNRYLQKTPW